MWRKCGDVPAHAAIRPAAGIDHRAGSRSSAGVIDTIRDAANSIARGMPSRRRQISTTAFASVALDER